MQSKKKSFYNLQLRLNSRELTKARIRLIDWIRPLFASESMARSDPEQDDGALTVAERAVEAIMLDPMACWTSLLTDLT